MDLYLMRHGIAEEWDPARPDAQRALTEEGVAKLERAVLGMRALGIQFDRVLTSPWRRAVETAERLGPLCPIAPEITERLCQSTLR